MIKLREQVERLGQDQAAILRELQQIRILLERAFTSGQGTASDRPPSIPTQGSPSLGSDSAFIAIVEFTDFQCPYCGRFFRETFGRLKAEYIDTDRVRWLLRDFPIESLHPDAFLAAEAAHCAGEQGSYWAMHDLLFERQEALDRASLNERATILPIHAGQFTECLASGRHVEVIRQGLLDGQIAGVTGTPFFFVGTMDEEGSSVRVVYSISGAKPYEEFKQVLDYLLSLPRTNRPQGN